MSDAELYKLYKKFYGERPLMVYANDLGLDSKQKMDFLRYAGQQGDSIGFLKGGGDEAAVNTSSGTTYGDLVVWCSEVRFSRV